MFPRFVFDLVIFRLITPHAVSYGLLMISQVNLQNKYSSNKRNLLFYLNHREAVTKRQILFPLKT